MLKKEKISLMLELRAQGMTYLQIANACGCSAEWVRVLIGPETQGYKPTTAEECIYPGLRKWMNNNRIMRRDILAKIDRDEWPSAKSGLAQIMRGEHQPTKPAIDVILKATGLTYEQCFGGVDSG